MEFTVFGRTFQFGLKKPEHKEKETKTTIIQLPNFTPRDSFPKLNERSLRNFSRKAIPRRAIALIRDGVLAQRWSIKPIKDGARLPAHAAQAVKNIVEQPNPIDNYRSFWGQIIDEALVGDNGSAEIVFTGKSDKPLELFPVNGFSLEYVKGFFTNPDFPRFCQVIDGQNRVYLDDRDIFYLQRTKTVDSPFGLSPLEAAFYELQALFDAEGYAHRQASNAFPKNALNLGEDVDEQSLLRFRKYFQEEVYGYGQTPILGGSKGASAIQIGVEDDKGLFLEWQRHLITVIALAFSVDPKKLGQGSNTDRSTVEEQNESLLSDAIRPYCLLVQDEINRKIIERLGLADVMRFEFCFEDTIDQQTRKQQIFTEQWINGGITLNEYREALGKKPLESEYDEMTQSEIKSALNKKYAVQTGGFNGLGKDRKDGVTKKLSYENKKEK